MKTLDLVRDEGQPDRLGAIVQPLVRPEESRASVAAPCGRKGVRPKTSLS